MPSLLDQDASSRKVPKKRPAPKPTKIELTKFPRIADLKPEKRSLGEQIRALRHERSSHAVITFFALPDFTYDLDLWTKLEWAALPPDEVPPDAEFIERIGLWVRLRCVELSPRRTGPE